MKLTAEEFMRRFLQHVLPSGFRKVRHYGLASARRQMAIELLKWLVTVTLQMVYVLTVCAQAPAPKPSHRCEHCGGTLKFTDSCRLPSAVMTVAKAQLNNRMRSTEDELSRSVQPRRAYAYCANN